MYHMVKHTLPFPYHYYSMRFSPARTHSDQLLPIWDFFSVAQQTGTTTIVGHLFSGVEHWVSVAKTKRSCATRALFVCLFYFKCANE